MTPHEHASAAIALLRQARDHMKAAGRQRCVQRIRAALSSAYGGRRLAPSRLNGPTDLDPESQP